MEPTIKNGEFVFVKQLQVSQDLQRTQLVMYTYPLEQDVQFGKRVIALPGETIEIRAKQVFVNGVVLNEPYVVHGDAAVYNDRTLPEPYRSRDNFGPTRLGEDEYFVLGDNRDYSMDSRYHGPVGRELVVGRIVLVGPREGPLRPMP